MIRSIIKNPDDNEKNFIKIKLNTDYKLLLNKTIEIPGMIMVVRAACHENSKYYPQVFLDECLYKLQNNIKMLHFDRTDVLSELMLLKQVCQKSVIFVTIGIFKFLNF